MCAVVAMFTCVFLGAVVFLGCYAVSFTIVFLLPYGNYVNVTRCLEFLWHFSVGA
jgi:hypothetical protein